MLCGAARFEAEVGTLNVSSDFTGAGARLGQGIRALCAQARLEPAALAQASVYLGLAGVTGPDMAARVAALVPAGRVRVEDDRPAALVGALGGRDGTVAGIGTGSFLARQSGSEVRLMGGWGLHLGDEASAAWLGRGGLALTLKTRDGLVPPSALTEALLAEFDGESAAIVAFAQGASPAEFGRFAPKIAAAAEDGDPHGLALMREGAGYIETAARCLGWRGSEALCLIGGLAPRYAPYLSAEMRDAVTPPAGTALDGAITLARRLRAEAGQ